MKSIRILAGLALLAGSLTTPIASTAVAQDGGVKGQELREYCYALIESGDFGSLNLGECMSFNETMGREGFVAHLCDALLELELLDDFGFTSYSDCILNA